MTQKNHIKAARHEPGQKFYSLDLTQVVVTARQKP